MTDEPNRLNKDTEHQSIRIGHTKDRQGYRFPTYVVLTTTVSRVTPTWVVVRPVQGGDETSGKEVEGT